MGRLPSRQAGGGGALKDRSENKICYTTGTPAFKLATGQLASSLFYLLESASGDLGDPFNPFWLRAGEAGAY